MTLAELAERANALPERIDFQWGGPEQWHQGVFERQVTTLPEAVAYIDKLRERMASYAMALHDLSRAYEQMRSVLLAFNLEADKKSD